MMATGHSLSGAAVFLAGSAAFTYFTQTDIPPVVLIMGTAVFAGAALAPDLDSFSSTVTRSYGIFGRIMYHLTNALSMLVYNVTKTQKDDPKENGHRTFMHTIVASILMGLLVVGLTSLPGTVNIFDKDFTWGQISALIIMAFFLHLGVAGLFAKQIKKAKTGIGAYILMAGSFITTCIVAIFLPNDEASYQWLAILVGAGYFVHILGDTITKMGTPMLWPLKIRGKRWYDIALPGPMRITAGGSFETAILDPLFIAVIIAGITAHVLFAVNVI